MLKTPQDPPQPPQSNLAVPAEAKYETPVARTSPFVYLLAIVFGLFSGWVNEKVDDALLTSLCVLGFTMILGVWKKGRPWRWLLLVWGGVPLVLAYYQYVVRWPHDRSPRWGGFLQILCSTGGAHGGHYMRDMIDHVFLKKDA